MAFGGALVGTLVELLGGPVGAVVGYGTGATVGVLSDIYNAGVNAGVGVDFVDTVSEKLTPGKTPVIAEVAEEWVTPLDTRMETIGGDVIRESR